MEQPVIEVSEEPGNPFITIWYKPRGTIRRIVDSDPERHVLLLAGISGIFQTLNRAAENTLGDQMSLAAILLFSFILGPMFGLIPLFISGAVLRWSGSWFGGTAESREVRAALAWSSLPDTVMLVLFLPIIAVFGRNWFTNDSAWAEEAGFLFAAAIAIVLLFGVVLTVWRLFLLIKCLAEVHGFSSWRAVASILAVIIPFLLIVFGCVFLTTRLAS